jgi:hypothetical protein
MVVQVVAVREVLAQIGNHLGLSMLAVVEAEVTIAVAMLQAVLVVVELVTLMAQHPEVLAQQTQVVVVVVQGQLVVLVVQAW